MFYAYVIALCSPLAFVPLLITAQESQACDQDKFKQCSEEMSVALGTQLGIPEMPGVAAQFSNMVIEMLGKKGQDGFVTFCKIIRDVESCLGDQKDICLTTESMKATFGLDNVNSAGYVVYFRQYFYQSTTAYNVFMKNFACMGEVYVNHKDDMGQCVQTYIAGITATPEKICKLTQEMIDCVYEFYEPCGKKTRRTMCDMLVYSLETINPQCRFACEA